MPDHLPAEKLDPLAQGIRIVCDGSVMGTRVFDSTGKDITRDLRIRSLTITHEVAGVPVAVLECLPAEVDVTIFADKARTTIALPGRNPWPDEGDNHEHSSD